MRPWLVLGFCGFCHRPVRERDSRHRAAMPGARIAVYSHLSCHTAALRPEARRH